MTPEEVEEAIKFAKYTIAWRTKAYEAYILEPVIALYWCHTRQVHRRALLSLAKDGWDAGHLILSEMATFLTEIGDPLPLWLQEYIVWAGKVARIRRAKGRDPLANLVRDFAIEQAVDSVSDRYGLKPTRNPATITECGSSIVMKALEGSGADMSEANVAAIWTKGHYHELDAVPAWSHRRGSIGIKFQLVDLENMDILAGTASRRENRGAFVAAVIDGSPAAKAGLQYGDIILRLGGKKITAVQRLSHIVRSTAIGKSVPIEVWRYDRRITLQAKIGPLTD